MVTAAERVYSAVEVREQILANCDQFSLASWLTLEKAALSSVVKGLYQTVTLKIAKNLDFDGPRGQLYRHSVQVIDFSWEKTRRGTLDVSQWQPLIDQFPNLRRLKREMISDEDWDYRWNVYLPRGSGGKRRVCMAWTANLCTPPRGEVSNLRIPAPMEGYTMEQRITLALYPYGKWVPQVRSDAIANLLSHPSQLHPDITQLLLHACPVELDALTAICKSRTAHRRPLIAISCQAVRPFTLGQFRRFISSVGPQIRVLELLHDGFRCRVGPRISLLDLSSVTDLIREFSPDLQVLKMAFSESVKPDGQVPVSERRYDGRLKAVHLAIKGGLCRGDLSKSADFSVAKNLACLGAASCDYRVLDPSPYRASRMSDQELRFAVRWLQRLSPRAQATIRHTTWAETKVESVKHLKQICFDSNGQMVPTQEVFARRYDEEHASSDAAENFKVDFSQVLSEFIAVNERRRNALRKTCDRYGFDFQLFEAYAIQRRFMDPLERQPAFTAGSTARSIGSEVGSASTQVAEVDHPPKQTYDWEETYMDDPVEIEKFAFDKWYYADGTQANDDRRYGEEEDPYERYLRTRGSEDIKYQDHLCELQFGSGCPDSPEEDEHWNYDRWNEDWQYEDYELYGLYDDELELSDLSDDDDTDEDPLDDEYGDEGPSDDEYGDEGPSDDDYGDEDPLDDEYGDEDPPYNYSGYEGPPHDDYGYEGPPHDDYGYEEDEYEFEDQPRTRTKDRPEHEYGFQDRPKDEYESEDQPEDEYEFDDQPEDAYGFTDQPDDDELHDALQMTISETRRTWRAVFERQSAAG